MYVLHVTWITLECHTNMRFKKEIAIYDCNQLYNAKKTNVPVQDELLTLSTVELEDGTVNISSDISLLFNQQRLDGRISPAELRNYIERYTPNASPYCEQMSDEFLMESLKSKNIQSLSEMKSWTEFCMSNYQQSIDDENERVRLENEAAALAAAADPAPTA